MATTILPIQAFVDGAAKVGKLPLEEIQVGIANDIHQRIHTAGNWNWTLGEILVPATPASDDAYTQEYSLVSNLSDCSRFVNGRLITPARGLNNEIRADTVRDLIPASFIPLTGLKGLPTHFQYRPGTPDKIRFSTSFSLEGTNFYGVYKKTVPVLTHKDLYFTTRMTIPDEWYYVFREGVLWKLYEYADDNRAGNVAIQGDRVQYSGQCAVFMAALSEMLSREPRFMESLRETPENVS